MYSVRQIYTKKLLKKKNGKKYSKRSLEELVRRHFTPTIGRYGLGYNLTDEDLKTLQNIINTERIWNTPITTKSNTSGSSVDKANQQET